MTEIEVISEAAAILAPFGKARAEYLTAEFAPFSDQFRPDLIFCPASSPELLCFVEFRLLSDDKALSEAALSEAELVRRLVAHKEFVSSPPNPAVVFVFASDRAFDSAFITLLNKHHVEVLGPVRSGADLAKQVRELTDSIKVSSPKATHQ